MEELLEMTLAENPPTPSPRLEFVPIYVDVLARLEREVIIAGHQVQEGKSIIINPPWHPDPDDPYSVGITIEVDGQRDTIYFRWLGTTSVPVPSGTVLLGRYSGNPSGSGESYLRQYTLSDLRIRIFADGQVLADAEYEGYEGGITFYSYALPCINCGNVTICAVNPSCAAR